MRWRAILATTAAIAAVVVSGCASAPTKAPEPEPIFIEGWYWVPDRTGLFPCEFRRWTWIPQEEDDVGFWERPDRQNLIAYVSPDLAAGRNAAGLLECYVFAKVSEAVARVMRAPALPWGFATESVFDHERRHWQGGLVHPQ